MKEISKDVYNKTAHKIRAPDDKREVNFFNRISEELPEDKNIKILELGCGSGGFAKVIYNKGYKNYTGVDFSDERVKIGKNFCPEQKFIVANIFSKKVKEMIDNADIIIMIEVLEHIFDDIRLLKMTNKKPMIITVPNFMCPNHVRCFKNPNEIKSRYKNILKNCKITDITETKGCNDVANKIFLIKYITA